MTKIVTRLIVIGVLTTLCTAIMVFSVILINKRSLQDAYIINIAGKERMLAQKITKETLIINTQNIKDYTELDASIQEFEDNLSLLRFGDIKRNISTQNREIITTKLNLISAKWEEFKTLVKSFKNTTSVLYEDRSFFYENNLKMLDLSDRIVKAMVNQNMSAKLIDDAGRQRMLTQNMAYALMYYINNWDDSAYKGFKESYNLYNAIINDFYRNQTYKKIPQLSSAINEAYAFWLLYSPHIDNILKTQENIIQNMRKITQQNTELLNEIDWLVGLYSDLSIHSRTYLEKFQYVAAFIMFLLAIYSLYHLLSIRKNINAFLHKTELLVSKKPQSSLAKEIQIKGTSELSIASQNISHFLQQIELTQETSNQAIQLSETISEEVNNIRDAIYEKLQQIQINDKKRQEIENAIHLGEDMAIQSGEQLLSASKLLKKLHKILQDIENIYTKEHITTHTQDSHSS